MRNICIVFAIFALAGTIVGQTMSKTTGDSKAASFSPHDLTGVWVGPDPQNGPPQKPGIRYQEVFGPLNTVPPLTPWGQARLNANLPGFGPRASLSGNDPTLRCEPAGMPRLMTFVTPMEVIQTPTHIVELIGSEWREIWTDGRKLPKDPEPTWNGYSVGKWEGDTLVVESVGFSDKSWVDQYGYPHSDAMRLVERYTRVSPDLLQLGMTIYDPKTYTEPWIGLTRPLKLHPNLELLDEPCDVDEMERFTKAVRVPAGDKGDK